MMTMNNKLNFYTEAVNEKMSFYLKNSGAPADLIDTMEYSVFAGGKRLRPALLLEANSLFSQSLDKALPFACAIEFIHTYSLIHDDLPAMDNDDYRRGKLTSHKMFGEDKAILAGDGLLSYAFEIMLNNICDNGTLQAARYIASAAGVSGMVAGQWVDVKNDGVSVDKTLMEYIHMHKTAAMISGALKAGGACAGAGEEDINKLQLYGDEIGKTFQIVDDILDVEGSTEELGKKVGSDMENGKTTYITLYGVEGAKKIAYESTEKAKDIIAFYGEKATFFIQLAEYMLTRRK